MSKVLVWTLVGGSILLILGVLFARLPFTLQFTYRKEGENDDLAIAWHLLGFHIPLVKVPVVSVDVKRMTPTITYRVKHKRPDRRKLLPFIKDVYKKLWRVARRYLRYLRLNLAEIRLNKLQWETRIGGQDAFETALMVGGLWAAKGYILARVFRFLDYRGIRPKVSVTPWYQGKRLDMTVDCIVTLRPGHIIVAGLWHAGILPVMLPKGGEKQNEPSDRSVDENGHGEYQGNGGRQYGRRGRGTSSGRQFNYPGQQGSIGFRGRWLGIRTGRQKRK